MRQKGILPPDYPVISEAEVNNMTDSYLKNLIQRNLVVSEAWLLNLSPIPFIHKFRQRAKLTL